MKPNPTAAGPKLELLEAREVPAVRILELGHTLDIRGDGHANAIAVRDDGKGTITVDAGGQHFTAAGIHAVNVDTAGGRDAVSYHLTGKLTTTETVSVWLGAGADKAGLDFTAGVGGGGHLKLDLHDGAGADRDAVSLGSVAKGGSAVLHVDGGRGADRISFRGSGEVGGRLAVTVRGGGGHDVEHVVSGVHTVGGGKVVVRTS